jgi:hypothetical protein
MAICYRTSFNLVCYQFNDGSHAPTGQETVCRLSTCQQQLSANIWLFLK